MPLITIGVGNPSQYLTHAADSPLEILANSPLDLNRCQLYPLAQQAMHHNEYHHSMHCFLCYSRYPCRALYSLSYFICACSLGNGNTPSTPPGCKRTTRSSETWLMRWGPWDGLALLCSSIIGMYDASMYVCSGLL